MVDNTEDIFEENTTTNDDLGSLEIITAQERYEEKGVKLDIDSQDTTDFAAKEKAKIEKKQVEELLSEYDKKKIKEANKPGNKYVELVSLFDGISADVNKKTIELLAIKHPEFLDLNDGVVTNKKGEVVETKEDFISATGFDAGDIIYDKTSDQFKDEQYGYFEDNINLANDAWNYIKTSYKTETGNLLSSLFYQGESETLDFGRYEEEIKIAVLNLMSGDITTKAAQEGAMDKGFSFNYKKLPIIGETLSLEQKELLIREAKGIVVSNQMKIQSSAAQNLKVLKDNTESAKLNLENNLNTDKDLAQRTQDTIDELNKKHGTYTYDRQGNIIFERYGKKFTKEDIQKHYDFVAKSLDNELVAYRSKRNGLLRIIDVETGYCLLADAGCPLTKNMNQALNIANKYFLKL